MTGIVFTELLAKARDRLGEQPVDRVIAASSLPSGGACTRSGNGPTVATCGVRIGPGA